MENANMVDLIDLDWEVVDSPQNDFDVNSRIIVVPTIPCPGCSCVSCSGGMTGHYLG